MSSALRAAGGAAAVVGTLQKYHVEVSSAYVDDTRVTFESSPGKAPILVSQYVAEHANKLRGFLIEKHPETAGCLFVGLAFDVSKAPTELVRKLWDPAFKLRADAPVDASTGTVVLRYKLVALYVPYIPGPSAGNLFMALAFDEMKQSCVVQVDFMEHRTKADEYALAPYGEEQVGKSGQMLRMYSDLVKATSAIQLNDTFVSKERIQVSLSNPELRSRAGMFQCGFDNALIPLIPAVCTSSKKMRPCDPDEECDPYPFQTLTPVRLPTALAVKWTIKRYSNANDKERKQFRLVRALEMFRSFTPWLLACAYQAVDNETADYAARKATQKDRTSNLDELVAKFDEVCFDLAVWGAKPTVVEQEKQRFQDAVARTQFCNLMFYPTNPGDQNAYSNKLANSLNKLYAWFAVEGLKPPRELNEDKTSEIAAWLRRHVWNEIDGSTEEVATAQAAAAVTKFRKYLSELPPKEAVWREDVAVVRAASRFPSFPGAPKRQRLAGPAPSLEYTEPSPAAPDDSLAIAKLPRHDRAYSAAPPPPPAAALASPPPPADWDYSAGPPASYALIKSKAGPPPRSLPHLGPAPTSGIQPVPSGGTPSPPIVEKFVHFLSGPLDPIAQRTPLSEFVSTLRARDRGALEYLAVSNTGKGFGDIDMFLFLASLVKMKMNADIASEMFDGALAFLAEKLQRERSGGRAKAGRQRRL